MKFGINKLTVAVAIAFSCATSVASASSLLYRNDYSIGIDYLGQALSTSSFSVVSTAGDLSSFNLSDYSVVVYANQANGVPSGDLARLDAYVAAGGAVIYNDWTGQSFGGASATGAVNQTTLTLGSQFSSGITGPLAVVNTGWGVFSRGLAGATSAGTFGNGDIAIAVGNGGRTIYNGFLSDTVASTKLYTNELYSLAPVPEPETYAMLLAGLGLIGTLSRRRRENKS